jgi:hypothetical protein
MVKVGVTVKVPGGVGVVVGVAEKVFVVLKVAVTLGVEVQVGVGVAVGGLLVKITSALVLLAGEPGKTAEADTVTRWGVSL